MDAGRINANSLTDAAALDAMDRHVSLVAALQHALLKSSGSVVAISTPDDVKTLTRVLQQQGMGLGQFVQDYVAGNKGVTVRLGPKAIHALGETLGRETLPANQPNDALRAQAQQAFLMYDRSNASSAFREGYRAGQRGPAEDADRTEATRPRVAVPSCSGPVLKEPANRSKC